MRRMGFTLERQKRFATLAPLQFALHVRTPKATDHCQRAVDAIAREKNRSDKMSKRQVRCE